MRSALILLIVVLSALAVPLPQEDVKVFFAFFVKGDGKRPTDEGELQEMQRAHIANLQKQFAAKKLIAAGPLKDPTQVRRGIMVLTVKDDKEIAPLFETDPYVKHRIMTCEFEPWSVDVAKFNQKLPDPNAIEENRIVIVTPGQALSRPEIEAYDAHVKATARKGIGGWVGKPGTRAIYLFQGPEEATLKSAFESGPLFAKGAIKVEVIPLWMAKEALPARK